MPPNPQTTSGWTVTGQQDTYGLDERNNAVEGIKIFFRSRGGHNSSVFLPRTSYNVQNARAALMAAAAMLDEVGQLKG